MLELPAAEQFGPVPSHTEIGQTGFLGPNRGRLERTPCQI